jgi:NDP-sugar pyrophosphorylase family protein
VDHFGDGGAFGVDIQYVAEENPLGTAGALGLLPPQDETLLIINGDILTDLDFGAMLRFHQKQQARLTVGVRQYQMRVPYGVIFGQEGLVTGLEEKPSYSFLVNAGIYLVEPAALALIPPQQFYNMTDLIEALLANKQTVASFPIIEYWLDIGQHGDYQQAQEDFDSGRIS